ncbi:MAG: response regulator [Nitrospirae bacterium]|nr:response regulator [Nitrospirota bacterium]NTW65888.1 response regulator [Nitrospirota bacterium]
MIVTCTCGAKLKISDDKLTEAGVQIKCPKCGTAHLVRRSAPAASEPVSEPAMPWFAPAASVASPPPPAPAVTVPVSAPKAEPRSMQRAVPVPSSSLVLVAHDSKLVAEMVQGVVKEAGLTVVHATDGLDALKKATALKPKVMIVDVGLTGIYGFELCERLKGDPDTRNIKIILLSSVYGLTAYKRNPVTLYGADDFIEKHHIPDRLVPKLRQLLSGQPAASPAPEESPKPSVAVTAKPSPQGPAASFTAPEVPDVLPKVPVTLNIARMRASSQSAPVPGAPPPKVDEPRAPQASPPPAVAANTEPPKPEIRRPAMQDESLKLDASFFEQDEYAAPVKEQQKAAVDPEEVERARRFARLIVSDIALYNQDAVAEGIARGTFYDLLSEDITEGRALYEKRVPQIIRQSKDYFQEAFDNFIAEKKKQR